MNKHELGMLIGLHAGDALGATLEFSPPRKRNDWLEDIVVGGPFQIAPGEGTDDTDLMIAVLASIRSRTEFSKEECLSHFLSWLETNPKDVGNTTRSNLLLQKRGLTPLISDEGQGNGSLMRCAPLALMALGTRNLSKVVQEQCALTQIVNRGDDSDTVGAVTGALCGAFYGVDQIPGRWLTKLIEKD